MAAVPYWAPTAREAVVSAFRREKLGNESDRMIDAERRLGILDDDWRDILAERLAAEYRQPQIRAMFPALITTEHNVAKRICSELATVYKRPATRRVSGGEAANASARLLWREARLDAVLPRVNYLGGGLRDVGLFIDVVDGQMVPRILTGDRVTVVQHPGKPSDAVALWWERSLSSTVGVDTIEHVYIDAERIATYDSYGKQLGMIEHGLGRLPVVWYHADCDTESFWSSRASDLFEANMTVGAGLFRLGLIEHYQSHLQVTYQAGADASNARAALKEALRGQASGPGSLWAAPGTFNKLDLQADTARILASIKAHVGLIAQGYGLAADVYDLSYAPSSGFQIRLKRLPLLEARERQQPGFRDFERELYTVMALVSQRFHPTIKLDPEADFSVDFGDEPFVEDPRTEADLIDRKIAQRRIKPWAPLMMDNPDLSEEEARALYLENDAAKAEVDELAATRNVARKPDKEPRTPEQNGADGNAARGKGGDSDEEWAARVVKELKR
jgi:hypothetical protein